MDIFQLQIAFQQRFDILNRRFCLISCFPVKQIPAAVPVGKLPRRTDRLHHPRSADFMNCPACIFLLKRNKNLPAAIRKVNPYQRIRALLR